MEANFFPCFLGYLYKMTAEAKDEGEREEEDKEIGSLDSIVLSETPPAPKRVEVTGKSRAGK